MKILITGGDVVTPAGPVAVDVLVDGEKVAAWYTRGVDGRPDVDEIVDARGMYVIPGGIDAHTHMEMPFGGTVASDDFETGPRAAAWGGTTTIIDFVVQRTGEDVHAAVEAWHDKAAGRSAIDYGFHMIIGGVDDDSLKAMDSLIDEGITSFKLFMAYPGVFYSDDGQILRAMQQAAGNGGLVMMHAENGPAIDVLAAQAVERGETAPIHHGLVRRSALEGEATHRAITLAELAGAPLYIVHLSASEALAEVVAARDRGANVFAETCPQYLYLNLEDHLGAPGFAGAGYVCSPPLRSKHEPHADDLWKGLRTNDLSIVATDHCPFCMKDQKEMGLEDFRAIPNGLGAVEHRLDLMYQGVVTGEITLGRWVEICSTTPARMFGLYPRKGTIEPGADADIVVYDPSATQTISVSTHHMNIDYSAFEGLTVSGKARTVLSRGSFVVRDGSFVGRSDHGTFLPRGLSSYLL